MYSFEKFLSQSLVCNKFYCLSKWPLNTVLCACLSVFQLLCSKGWSSPLHWCREVAAVRTQNMNSYSQFAVRVGVCSWTDEGHVLPQ